jgi:hypothetical protein
MKNTFDRYTAYTFREIARQAFYHMSYSTSPLREISKKVLTGCTAH